jgi:hypothetical protein
MSSPSAPLLTLTRLPHCHHHPPGRLGDLLRPHVEPAVRQIADEIGRHFPAHAVPGGRNPDCRLLALVGVTVRGFVDAVDGPAPAPAALTATYQRLGTREARHGHGLEGMEAALRLSGQIACRRLIEDARAFDWPHDTLAMLTERLFRFLDHLADAAAEGHTASHRELVTEREQRRARLRDALVADPPPGREAIAELAEAADWVIPDTLCVIVPHSPASADGLALPTVLADRTPRDPYLIVPDPDGPGRHGFMETLAEHCPGAVGPTVPLDRGRISLTWARRAAALIAAGALPADGAVRCVDHLATLTADLGRDLIDAAAPRYLRALLELPSPRREILAETLLSFLTHNANAVKAGKDLHIHAQTVRYRMGVITRMFGDELPGAESRLATMITLNALLRLPASRPVQHSSGST